MHSLNSFCKNLKYYSLSFPPQTWSFTMLRASVNFYRKTGNYGDDFRWINEWTFHRHCRLNGPKENFDSRIVINDRISCDEIFSLERLGGRRYMYMHKSIYGPLRWSRSCVHLVTPPSECDENIHSASVSYRSHYQSCATW